MVLSVDAVFHVLPGEFRHGENLVATLHFHAALVFVDADDASDLAVEEGLLGAGVVFDEHHLGTDFQFQFFLGREGVFGESAFDVCIEENGFGRKCLQFRLVDLIGLVVVGGQGDITLVVTRMEVGEIALVEELQAFGIHAVVTHLVEQGDEVLVVLPIHVIEFHAEVRRLLQDVTA